MRFSTFSDYSLRVLMYLTGTRDRLATISEISRAYGISENHLMKVVHQLGKAGYIETVRGKGGGMRLAQEPQDILVGEVFRRTENDCQLVDCMSPHSTCRIRGSCRAKNVMGEALAAMFAVMNRYSIADMVDRPAATLLASLRPGA